MTTELYEFVQTRLSGLGIKHYDWWNDQINTQANEDPFECPAVFFEALPYEEQPLGRRRSAADITFVVHLVHQPYERLRRGARRQAVALAKLENIRQVITALKGKNNGSTIGSITTSTALPDNKNEGYIDNKQQFKVRMYSDASVKATAALPDGIPIIVE